MNRAINSLWVIVWPKMAVTMTPSQWEMGPNELKSYIKGHHSSAVKCYCGEEFTVSNASMFSGLS